MIAMVVMPGTDTALVTKNTLAHGIRGGQATVLGIGTGLIVHTMAAVLGLSAIIILNHIRTWFKKPTFQTVFQRVTGLMLISLGVKLVFEKR
jgi:threonine/homoserine/homoserine lactone efflux protein